MVVGERAVDIAVDQHMTPGQPVDGAADDLPHRAVARVPGNRQTVAGGDIQFRQHPIDVTIAHILIAHRAGRGRGGKGAFGGDVDY